MLLMNLILNLQKRIRNRAITYSLMWTMIRSSAKFARFIMLSIISVVIVAGPHFLDYYFKINFYILHFFSSKTN